MEIIWAALIVLKALGLIGLSWFWVMLPLWIAITFWVSVLIVGVLVTHKVTKEEE